jgi:hypothetical protein
MSCHLMLIAASLLISAALIAVVARDFRDSAKRLKSAGIGFGGGRFNR